MKKFLLFMLGVLIALPGIARDFTYEYEGQTLTYTVIDEDAKTCKTMDGYYDLYQKPGNNVSGTLVIPSVAKDGDIEYAVTAIGEKAFYNCSSLKSVTIPESVIEIGESAFSDCYSLTSVIIPNSVNSIGNSAFYSCAGLTSVTIPNSVNSIGNGAFRRCSGLTSVIIPESVTEIGNYVFTDCLGLKKSAYPSGLNNPFSRGRSIQYPREGAIIEDGFVYGPEKKTIYFAPLSLEGEYIIPESVTSIGQYAFSKCSRPISVTIPGSFTEIGYRAFAEFSGLTSVTIPESVMEIGSSAFYGCYGLTSMTIPNSVTKIDEDAFYGCSGLSSVTIPNSVNSIGSSAFYGCSGLTSVSIGNSVTAIGRYAFYNSTGLKSVSIGNSVTSIGFMAFYNCSDLTSVTIPNSVTTIDEEAFYGCSSLTSVTIGNSITKISNEAFGGCTAMTEVILPPSVKQIGASAFAGNSKLASIIMGHNITYIGPKAFDLCPAATIYITAQTPPNVKDEAFSFYYYERKLYVQGQQAADVYSRTDCLPYSPGQLYVMNEPTELKVEGDKTLTGKPGDTFQLKATLYPEDVTLPYVFWRSTNPDIATVDANGLVTLHADMSDVMAMAADDDASTNSCKIIAESLYADGPVAEFTVNNITTGIEDMIHDGGNASGDIDFSAPAEVYNLQGVRVAHSVQNLVNGIYIVRQGNNVRKIVVK